MSAPTPALRQLAREMRAEADRREAQARALRQAADHLTASTNNKPPPKRRKRQ